MTKEAPKRGPFVHLPLSFDQAVRGVLAVKPEKASAEPKPVGKPARKKAVKREPDQGLVYE